MSGEELRGLLVSWADKYKINTQLEIIREQLSEPQIVRVFNDFCRDNMDEKHCIDYKAMDLESLISLLVDGSEVEGYLIVAMYFVIDFTSLFYNYQCINFEQMNSFQSISNISVTEVNCARFAYMLENDFDISNYFRDILDNDVPYMFHFYFLSSLNRIRDYKRSWELYNFFSLMPDLDIRKARAIVRTICGNGNLDKAMDFIRNYSSPDMKEIDIEILEDLLIELFSTVMERDDGDEILKETYFTSTEYDILQNYAKQTIQFATWNSHEFIKKN